MERAMTKDEPVNILLVDDTPGKLLSYEVILQDLGENLIKVNSAKAALAELLKTEVAVILTDVCMPDLDGFEFAAMLRQHPRYERTAVIFISAVHLSDYDYVRGYNCGAVDYVSVPVVPEILRAKVKIFVELFRKTKQLERLNSELEHRVSQRTTELEESSSRLMESEKRLKLASRAAGFGSYEYDVKGDRMHWSSQLKPFADAGVPAPESLESFLEIVHADDRTGVRTSMLAMPEDAEKRRDIEFRAVLSDGKERWILDRGQVLHDGLSKDGDGCRVLGTMLDITERKNAEAHQGLLLAELDHRVKNILANVMAIASLSSKHAISVGSFVNALQGRIQSMATAHDLLRRSNWKGADFHGLARESLKPFQSREGNIQVEGSGARLNPKAAQSLALVLHELATNAVKHGALSHSTGCVTISCERIPNGRPGKLRFTWRERGGPAVEMPGTEGFGLTALRAAAYEAAAHADIAFEPEGLVYTLEGPLTALEEFSPREGNSIAQSDGLIRSDAALGGASEKRYQILVVEDEPLVAIELQSVLEGEGHTVVGPAMNLARGLDLARADKFDLAFLDISLGEEKSFPIARELARRRIPFAFVTGYTDVNAVPEELRGATRIQKPYGIDDIKSAIDRLASPLPDSPRATARAG
jgi:two-component sensor histidine kinase/DNA-binding response OmpR family regulator